MKRIIYIAVFILVFVSSCDTKKEELDSAPSYITGVKNLVAISGKQLISLSWDNEVDAYDYVVVKYNTDKANEIRIDDVNSDKTQVEFPIPDAKVYKFEVTSFKNNGEHSETVSVKGRVLENNTSQDEVDEILSSLKTISGNGGVKFLWENPSNLKGKILIMFKNNDMNQTAEIELNRVIKEYTIDKLTSGQAYEFTVQIKLEDDQTSTPVQLIAFAKAKFQKLNRENWTITASSEETVAEDGRAVNLLDGSSQTYWRSRTSSPTATYPHQLVVDMKSSKNVGALTLQRKFQDNDYSSWDNSFYFSEDGINWSTEYLYANNSTHSNPIFKVEFNRTIEGEQIYRLPAFTKARYIKLISKRGGRSYAIFSELNVLGEE